MSKTDDNQPGKTYYAVRTACILSNYAYATPIQVKCRYRSGIYQHGREITPLPPSWWTRSNRKNSSMAVTEWFIYKNKKKAEQKCQRELKKIKKTIQNIIEQWQNTLQEIKKLLEKNP